MRAGLGRCVWFVGLLAAAACGSSGDAASSGDDAHTDDAATDTLAALDSMSPLDTRGDDVTPADTRGTDTIGTDTTPTETGTDASLGPYPAGPYGKNAGDVIANLQWEGYANDAADALVSTKPYGKYSMDSARLSGRRYALLHVSEFF